jgi:uncharacterized phiE125 gp8 family phage protein
MLYPASNLVVHEQPVNLPVDLAIVKQSLGRDSSLGDAQLTLAIKTAVEVVQSFTNTILINTTFQESVNDFFTNQFFYDGSLHSARYITLMAFPAKTIHHFRIFDEDGTSTLIPSTDYFLDIPGNRFYLKDGFSSTSSRRIAGYRIEYVAGKGATSASIDGIFQSAIIAYTGKVIDMMEARNSSLRFSPEWESAFKASLMPVRRFAQLSV